MNHNINTNGKLSSNSHPGSRPLHIAGGVGGILILGAVGYGIYTLVKVFVNNEDDCTTATIPQAKLITNCTTLGGGANCRETFNDATIYCPFDRALAVSTTPTGLVKRAGVSYDVFILFVESLLPNILNLHCLNSNTVMERGLQCCSAYNLNTSICNGFLPQDLVANAVIFPSMRNITVCTGVSCTSVLSVYSAAIDLEAIRTNDTCASHILWSSSMQAGAGYNWDVEC